MKSEAKFVAALRRGEERAVRKMVDDFGPRLYNVALRILRHHQDAEDAVQEAFITALDKLDQFDGRSQFLTWIYRITVNSSLMLLRKRRSQQRKEERFEVPRFEDIRGREPVDWGADPARKMLTAEMRQVMDGAIEKLPAKYRVVFVLRDLEEFSTQETSQILGITPSNVKIRLMRARLFLREELAKYFKETDHAEVKP